MTIVSERIKQARKNNKLTQEELAKKVNITKATISNYENGYSSPSNEMLVDLSDVLNVTTDYLLGRDSVNHFNSPTKQERCLGNDLISEKEYKFLTDVLKSYRESNE